MKQDWTEKVEKWLIRLVVIQCLVLLFGQLLMSHSAWTPYLNRAVQDEGVFKTNKTDTIETMEPSPAVWYDKISTNKTKK